MDRRSQSLGATTDVDSIRDAEAAIRARRHEVLAASLGVLKRLTNKPPLQELPHYLPRLRDVPPEQRPQVGRARRHRPQEPRSIHDAGRVEVGQLRSKAILPGQLLAQPLADHARGSVTIGQRVE